MISVSGIRGIIGNDLTPENTARFASAFGIYSGGGTIVVGRDTRNSGPMMLNAVTAGLNAVGCDVLDIGISTTPTIQLAVEENNASGGIAITASHNPSEWNAMKFFSNKGLFLGSEGIESIKNLFYTEKIKYVDSKNLGNCVATDSFDTEHINAVLRIKYIDSNQIKNKKFKVAVDCVNGAASNILPELLKKLDVDVVRINCDMTKDFPRGAEPLPENLIQLGDTVRENSADLGLACDPDGDRLAIVDENGLPIGEDYTLAFAIQLVLGKNSGSAATNVSTSALIDDAAALSDSIVHKSRVGEINVVNKMIEKGCIIGGEGNGGVILPDVHYGRDALVGTVLILQLLTETGKSVSELAKDLPKYYLSKNKISLDTTDLDAILARIQNSVKDAGVDTTDGLKLLYPGKWVHMRKSNTEPIIRIYTEANSQSEADTLAQEYIDKINSL